MVVAPVFIFCIHLFKTVSLPGALGLEIKSKISSIKGEKTFLISSCNDGSKKELVFDSKAIYLNSFHLSSPENAAEQQLKYLVGQIHFGENNTQIFMGSKPVIIKDISVTKATYPVSLQPRTEWGKKFNFKKIRKGDAAIQVRFRAVAEVLVCDSFNAKSIDLIFPLDPFLAYWSVPDNRFLNKTFGSKSLKVNPCAHAEMADIQDPSWFWYLWDPNDEICLSEIKKNSHNYYKVTAEIKDLVKSQNISSNFWPQQQNTTNLLAIFGSMDIAKIKKTVGFFKENLRKGFLLDDSNFFKKINPTEYDFAAAAMFKSLYFVHKLDKVLQVHIEYPSDESMYLQVNIQSKHRPMNIYLYYGPTSLDYRSSPDYKKFIKKNWAQSDFILYLGHAGAGSNFKLLKIFENENDVLTNVASKKVQGIVIMSCFAQFYFGEDILNSRRKNKTFLAKYAGNNYSYPVFNAVYHFLRQKSWNQNTVTFFINYFLPKTPFVIEYYDSTQS